MAPKGLFSPMMMGTAATSSPCGNSLPPNTASSLCQMATWRNFIASAASSRLTSVSKLPKWGLPLCIALSSISAVSRSMSESKHKSVWNSAAIWFTIAASMATGS